MCIRDSVKGYIRTVLWVYRFQYCIKGKLNCLNKVVMWQEALWWSYNNVCMHFLYEIYFTKIVQLTLYHHFGTPFLFWNLQDTAIRLKLQTQKLSLTRPTIYNHITWNYSRFSATFNNSRQQFFADANKFELEINYW